MAKQGFRAKIWVREGGTTTGTAEWLALGGARDCTLNTTMGEGDATHRAGAGFTMTLAILEDASVDAEILWIDDDDAQLVLEAAYASRGVVGVRMLDSDDDETGIGLEANCQVLNLTRREPLNDTIKADLTLKPTYSSVAPRWVEDLGASSSPAADYDVSGVGQAWSNLGNAVSSGGGVASVSLSSTFSEDAEFTFDAATTNRPTVLLRVRARTAVLSGTPYLAISSNLTEDDISLPLDATLQTYDIPITPVEGWEAIVAGGTANAIVSAVSAGAANDIELDLIQLIFP